MKFFQAAIYFVVTLSMLQFVSAGEKTERCLVMPEELVETAERNGYFQVDDFFISLPGQYLPPYVYGYKTDRFAENSAAFWGKKSKENDSTDSYYLIFAEREYVGQGFQIVATVKKDYPIGLLLNRDNSVALDSLVLESDWKIPGPKGIKAKDFGIESNYDGNANIYYLYKGQVLVKHDWDI